MAMLYQQKQQAFVCTTFNKGPYTVPYGQSKFLELIMQNIVI